MEVLEFGFHFIKIINFVAGWRSQAWNHCQHASCTEAKYRYDWLEQGQADKLVICRKHLLTGWVGRTLPVDWAIPITYPMLSGKRRRCFQWPNYEGDNASVILYFWKNVTNGSIECSFLVSLPLSQSSRLRLVQLSEFYIILQQLLHTFPAEGTIGHCQTRSSSSRIGWLNVTTWDTVMIADTK